MPKQMQFTVGPIVTFPGKGDRCYVAVPRAQTAKLARRGQSGPVLVEAKLGDTLWAASLQPVGDGSYFLAVKAEVRKAEKVDTGDKVRVGWRLA
jgi:hypothetical protein